MNEKLVKMILYAFIGIDLIVVCVVMVLVNPFIGLLIAAVLALGDYIVYIVLMKQVAERNSLEQGANTDEAPPE